MAILEQVSSNPVKSESGGQTGLREKRIKRYSIRL